MEAYAAWRIENAVRVPRISSLKWRDKLDRSLYLEDAAFRIRATAEEAVRQVLEGATYSDLRRTYEADETVAFTDLGWKVWKEIDRSLAKHVFPLEVGQFSSIVSLPDGYHIVHLADDKVLDIQTEVLFLRAKKFDRMVKEERITRSAERRLVARYDFKPDSAGVRAAMQSFAMAFNNERPGEELLAMPVATFKGGEVLVADLFTFYFNSPPDSRFYFGDGYSVVKGAWELALPDIYTQAGYDMRLDELQDVKWVVAKERRDYLIPQMEDSFRSSIDITDADIEAYYEERREDLVTGSTYRARRILLETQAEVEQVAAGLRAGQDFADLARRYSHDEYTASKGGDMGAISRGMVAVYDSVLADLEPGDITRPFPTNSGIEILMLEEKGGGRQLTFEEAVPLIEMYIRNQTANDMLKDLVELRKEEWGYWVNEDLLARVWLPEPDWKESMAQPSEN
jgi:parvulin-like peptidyl-prolyl isomerase